MLLTCFTVVDYAYSSNNTAKEMSSAEKQKVVGRLKNLQKDIYSITASVNMEKHLSSMKKKINVEGIISLKKPNMLRWATVKPEKSLTVVDGETMTVYHPEVKEAQIYDLSEDIIARNVMNFFTSAMWGTLNEMEKKFTVNIFRKDDSIVFELAPLSKMTARHLSSIVIYYDETTGIPNGFTTTTPKGDKNITRLTNIVINPEIRNDSFRIKLHEDVWITNKSEHNNN